MKIKLDEKTIISLRLSDEKDSIILSTQVESSDGKVFLNTVSLNEDSVDTLLTKLVMLRAKL
tara:strand:- start:3194 stop:3379 length:186 start_codon:yes stop_codon:yes gene_type:complete